jgi:hypothetical protein
MWYYDSIQTSVEHLERTLEGIDDIIFSFSKRGNDRCTIYTKMKTDYKEEDETIIRGWDLFTAEGKSKYKYMLRSLNYNRVCLYDNEEEDYVSHSYCRADKNILEKINEELGIKLIKVSKAPIIRGEFYHINDDVFDLIANGGKVTYDMFTFIYEEHHYRQSFRSNIWYNASLYKKIAKKVDWWMVSGERPLWSAIKKFSAVEDTGEILDKDTIIKLASQRK